MLGDFHAILSDAVTATTATRRYVSDAASTSSLWKTRARCDGSPCYGRSR